MNGITILLVIRWWVTVYCTNTEFTKEPSARYLLIITKISIADYTNLLSIGLRLYCTKQRDNPDRLLKICRGCFYINKWGNIILICKCSNTILVRECFSFSLKKLELLYPFLHNKDFQSFRLPDYSPKSDIQNYHP